MGITVHYKGKIKDRHLIEPLKEEMIDICESMEWEYHLYDKPLKGIIFQPHKDCEPVQLLFNDKGRLTNFLSVIYEDKSEDKQNRRSYWIHTKTHFAGTEVHIVVIKLLKYIRDKYMACLEVDDEGGYWNIEDKKILIEKLKKRDI